MAKKVLFVLNPKAGKGLIKNKILDILDLLVKNGLEVTVHTTQRKLDGYEKVKNHGKKYQYLLISGGDGTLSECIKGLMEIEDKKRPVVGYIPAGSTNDFAQSLKLPKNMITAANNLVAGNLFKCDIGKFNNDYFIYIAAFGAFTDVSYDTPQDLKNLLGHTAYILEGIKRVASLQKYSMTIEHDGTSVSGEYIYGMISNTISVGGLKSLGKEKVKLDDGLFEVILVKYPHSPIEIQMIVTGILTSDFSSKVFTTFKTSRAVFKSQSEVHWTLDGEDGGAYKETVIEHISKAIPIMVSPKKSKPAPEKWLIHDRYKIFILEDK